MIHVELPGTMECIEKGCVSQLGIRLALNVMGTLMPRIPTGHGWQIGQSANGAFVCRCPSHHSMIEQAPSPKLGDVLQMANGKH